MGHDNYYKVESGMKWLVEKGVVVKVYGSSI
jgi:hypothetical protein